MGIPTSQYLAQKEAFSTQTVSEIREARGQQLTNREKNLHFLEIDNQKIGGYGTYSFYIQKTYAKEPTRSSSGSIDNLDSYSTFLTPTVKIKFNALSLEQYQKIIKIIHSKNEHLVKCYDIVYDEIREFNAYFAPDDYPELFVYDFELIGVLNYEIELIGTNTSLNKCSITYHLNDPDEVVVETRGSNDYSVGQEVIIGEGAEEIKTLEGYTFDSWNTKVDGTGQKYVDNTAYALNADLVLYAQWISSGQYTLSYNYGIGNIPTNENGENITSKVIKKGDVITYQSTAAPAVTFLEEEYRPYGSQKWYWHPQYVEGAEEVISGETVYNIDGNATIYQIFDKNVYSVKFHLVTDGATVVVSGEYGSNISIPEFPEGSGYNAWLITKIEEETVTDRNLYFEGTTMPPVNIEVRARHK